VSIILLAPGAEEELRYWVGVASHAAGAEDSRWRSDLIVRNRGAGAASVELSLHRPAGVVSRTLTLDPGQHVTQADIVGWIDSGFSGSAALELVSDQPLDVTSRTYNLLAEGATCFPGATFGQSFRGARAREGFVNGQTVTLVGLAEWSDFRTNIGLTNASTLPSEVVVSLYDDDDALVYTSPPIDLDPGEWYQLYRPYREQAGRQDIHSGRAAVEVRAGTGVLVYASLADNRTNDAATLWALP
jgi:hypothetical protein